VRYLIIFDKEVNTKNALCFLHIPKTGGKTLWNLFEKQEKNILVWHSEYFKPLPYTFFTMLRDPADRIMSTYYYIKRYKRDPLHKQVREMTLEDFIGYMCNENIVNKRYNSKNDLRNIRYRTVNLATRYLSGGDPDNIEKAKNNLNRYFSLVGITESYFESVFLMQKEFNLKFTQLIKINETKNRPKVEEISKKIIQKIIEINKHDSELYLLAKKLFYEKLNALSADEKIELNNWKNNVV